MKKNIVKIISIAVLISSTIFLAGCGKKTTNTAAKVIDMTMFRPTGDEAFFKEKINDFNEQNSNYKLKLKELPIESYELDSLNTLAAQKGPDIWNIRNDWMGKHYDKLAPVPEGFFKKDKKDKKTDLEHFSELFPKVAADDLIVNNKIYGIPLGIDTLVLYYNPKLMFGGLDNYNEWAKKNSKSQIEQYPETWEELVNLTPYLTKRDGDTISQSAIALGTSNNVNRATDILYLLMLQNGTQIVSKDNLTATFNLNTQTGSGAMANPGLSALDFFTSFSNSKKPTYTWNSSMPESIEAFTQGKVAMMIGYGYFENVFKQKAPEFKFVSAPVPQIAKNGTDVNYANYWVETVPKSSKNQKIAWEFIKNYTTLQKSVSYGRSRDISPAYTEVYNKDTSDPRYTQPQNAKTFNKGKQPEKTDALISEMINAVNSGTDQQKAIDEAATKLTNTLRE